MAPIDTREVWLRGPLPDMPPLVQPVAHALMQARDEVIALMHDFPQPLLWEQPMGRSETGGVRPLASVGFHLQHLSGVLDRLFTYALGRTLSTDQLTALAQEGQDTNPPLLVADLVRRFDEQVEQALAQLRTTDPQTLTEARGVGRAQLPSTVIGLYVHAAEHTTRHLGQLLVTARIVRVS